MPSPVSRIVLYNTYSFVYNRILCLINSTGLQQTAQHRQPIFSSFIYNFIKQKFSLPFSFPLQKPDIVCRKYQPEVLEGSQQRITQPNRVTVPAHKELHASRSPQHPLAALTEKNERTISTTASQSSNFQGHRQH